jgi:2-dehydro-3-deoxyphosphogluconate aldolase/(4S)-4-hydroxy-2-oxoglutarate aldolase
MPGPGEEVAVSRFVEFTRAEWARLRAATPLPDLLFCPTGGIDAETYLRYLDEPNVLCVGGSWMVPMDSVHRGDWTSILDIAREIAQ